jgi:hypothetical protein
LFIALLIACQPAKPIDAKAPRLIDADTAPVATIREDNRFVEYCRDCLPLGFF